jgi:hypothetical protein
MKIVEPAEIAAPEKIERGEHPYCLNPTLAAAVQPHRSILMAKAAQAPALR